MRTNPTLYLVCYDVRDDKRLRRVYKIMRGFGDHIQYSVFRCVLSPRQFEQLRQRLLEVVNCDEDQVLPIPLGRASAKRAWRVHVIGTPLTNPERVVRVF